jgi:predicted permease
MLPDLRLGLRTLARTPLFTALAATLLALGVGGAVAVFSLVDGVLLKALPYPDPDRVVTVWEATEGSRTIAVSAPNFRDWQQSATSFDALGAWTGGRTTVLGGREPVVTGVYGVTREYFAALGVGPALGRSFVPEETRENGAPAVVVSHGFWTRVLGAAPGLADLSLEIEGKRAAVVGVMADGFAYPPGAEVWFPFESNRDTSGRTAHNLRVVARLRPTATLASAQAEMSTVARRLESIYGTDHDGTDASVIPLHDYTVRGSRQLLLVLFGGVAIVLLATCPNVANMVIARGTDRQRELALRLALGASRIRLVRMLLVENALLAAGSAVAGLAVAVGLVRGLVAMAPASIPRLDQVRLDTRTALFATALAVLTPVVFGLWPALQLSRRSPRDILAEGGRLGTGASGRFTWQGLVALEVAVALLLVTAAGLLAQSVMRLLAVDPGFQPAQVLNVQTTVPSGRFTDPEAGSRLYGQWVARAATVPGVAAVGLVNAPPLSGLDANGGFMLDGQAWDDVKANWVAQSAVYRIASDGYFQAMGMALTRGRGLDARDVSGAEPAAVVNEALARKHFAGRDPLGQRIRFAGMDEVNPWLTIVGVVRDVRFRDLGAEAAPEVYVDYRQLPFRTRYFMSTAVRLQPGIGVDTVTAQLRDAWRNLDPSIPIEISPMTALVDRSTASRRFTLAVVAAFGTMALLLSGLGVYGVLSFSVAQRAREIGIRMALGATRRSVTGLVFLGAAVPVVAGVAVGVLAALGLTRFLQALLFGVTALDPGTFAAASLTLLVVASAAAWVPASRASRIDPAVVMRQD